MKLRFAFFFFLWALCSCRLVQPLKSPTDIKAFKIVTASTYENAWNKILSYCLDNGIAVKTNNKTDGLMVVEKTGCKLTYLKENEIMDSTAWMVAQRVKENGGGNKFHNPTNGIVEWKIYLTKEDPSAVSIRIIPVTPIKVTNTIMNGFKEKERTYSSVAFSTGFFEKEIQKLFTP